MQNQSLLERWFPHPFVSCLVALSWLMLASAIDTTNLVTALFLGILVPRLVKPFIARTPDIHWGPAVRLSCVVLWDIIVSNFRVARLVIGPTKNLHPKWYRVPLETEHEQVNTLLAMIITTTPGTVSAGIDQERGDILVHALSSDNVELDIQEIKFRYEKALLEIFHVTAQGDQP